MKSKIVIIILSVILIFSLAFSAVCIVQLSYDRQLNNLVYNTLRSINNYLNLSFSCIEDDFEAELELTDQIDELARLFGELKTIQLYNMDKLHDESGDIFKDISCTFGGQIEINGWKIIGISGEDITENEISYLKILRDDIQDLVIRMESNRDPDYSKNLSVSKLNEMLFEVFNKYSSHSAYDHQLGAFNKNSPYWLLVKE